jgi:hypothetical protein
MTLPEINISPENVRKFVLQSVNQRVSFRYSQVCADVAAFSIQNKLLPDPTISFGYSLHLNDRALVREVIWDLIVERILTVGDYVSDEWPSLSVTERGRHFLQKQSEE